MQRIIRTSGPLLSPRRIASTATSPSASAPTRPRASVKPSPLSSVARPLGQLLSVGCSEERLHCGVAPVSLTVAGPVLAPDDVEDLDDAPDDEVETAEGQILDQATAASTMQELKAELTTLDAPGTARA